MGPSPREALGSAGGVGLVRAGSGGILPHCHWPSRISRNSFLQLKEEREAGIASRAAGKQMSKWEPGFPELSRARLEH